MQFADDSRAFVLALFTALLGLCLLVRKLADGLLKTQDFQVRYAGLLCLLGGFLGGEAA